MRKYKKDRSIKETEKLKSNNQGVYQENLMSKKAKGRECFKKDVVHNIESW